MSVPGLRSGSGHNPHTRMPASPPALDMVHEKIYTRNPSKSPITEHKKVRTRGRVMGTPGKIPADIYANVIKGRQRARKNTADDLSGRQT